MRHSFLLATLTAIPLAAGACTSVRARAYAGLSQTFLQGDVALDSGSGNLNLGTNRPDVGDELGLDGGEVSPYLRAELGLPFGGVTVSGFTFSQTGSGTLDPTHQYGDIPGGTTVSSHLAFANVKAAAHYDLLNLGILRLSPGLGVDFVDFDIDVSDSMSLTFESVDNRVFVPMLFAQAEVDVGIVAATLDVGYMQANLRDAKGQYLDIEGLVRVNPLPLFEIFAGYRYIGLDARGVADDRHYDADLRLHGWMLGGGISF